MRINTLESIVERLVPMDSGCVEWPGTAMESGYCCVGYQSRPWLIHRLLYVTFVGPIAKGLDLHHSCRNRRCVNMEHLRPVTRKEHVHLDNTFARLHALKTHCPKGHPYEGDNVLQENDREGPHRKCRTCLHERRIARRKGGQHGTETHCPQGHPYAGGNLVFENGRLHRRCRTCRNKRAHTRYERLKATRIP